MRKNNMEKKRSKRKSEGFDIRDFFVLVIKFFLIFTFLFYLFTLFIKPAFIVEKFPFVNVDFLSKIGIAFMSILLFIKILQLLIVISDIREDLGLKNSSDENFLNGFSLFQSIVGVCVSGLSICCFALIINDKFPMERIDLFEKIFSLVFSISIIGSLILGCVIGIIGVIYCKHCDKKSFDSMEGFNKDKFISVLNFINHYLIDGVLENFSFSIKNALSQRNRGENNDISYQEGSSITINFADVFLFDFNNRGRS